VTKAAGLAAANVPSGIGFLDYDHDGDLDLFVTGAPLQAGGSANVLWRNNGNGTFTNWTEPTGLGGSGRSVAATLSDLNNDRAVDIAVSGEYGAPQLFMNPREGKYPVQPLTAEAGLSASQGIAAFDFDKDGWMDVVVTHAGAPGVSLWHNIGGKSYERVKLPVQGAGQGIGRAWGVTPIDVDNDGWIDLAVVVETAKGSEVRVFRNRRDGGFEDVSTTLGLNRVKLDSPRGLIAADVDRMGQRI